MACFTNKLIFSKVPVIVPVSLLNGFVTRNEHRQSLFDQPVGLLLTPPLEQLKQCSKQTKIIGIAVSKDLTL